MMFMKDKLIDNTISDDTLIYHYTSFNSACMILDTKRVRLSSLVNTNDPLEFMDKSLNIIEHDIHNTTRTIDCELNKSFVERQNIVRLLCFSVDFPCIGEEKNQEYTGNLLFKGWARSRMWAQYADNHRGVCLVFDKDEFRKDFGKLRNDDIEIFHDQKITYTNNLSDLDENMTHVSNNDKIDGSFEHFYLDEKRRKYLFQKCEDYRDENEYRFVLADKKLKSPNEEKYVEYTTSLKAIILGPRFPKNIRFSKLSGVEVYQINWEYDGPYLIPLTL